MVGRETICIFCLTRCSTKEKRPQILNCLHSACLDCFKESCTKEAATRKMKPGSNTLKSEIDGDESDDCCEAVGDCAEIEVAVVPCPLCEVSTAEYEIRENIFLQVIKACCMAL